MKVIAARIWFEPAVAIGALTSAIAAYVGYRTGMVWDTVNTAAVLAPLISSLGIRAAVTPVAKTKIPEDHFTDVERVSQPQLRGGE